MNEAEEPTPETSTPDAGSTRDATLGRFILWTAVGIGIIAAGKAIANAALSNQREAQLERVLRAGVEARRWGLPPGPSTSGPTVQRGENLLKQQYLRDEEMRQRRTDEQKRHWQLDDDHQDRLNALR